MHANTPRAPFLAKAALAFAISMAIVACKSQQAPQQPRVDTQQPDKREQVVDVGRAQATPAQDIEAPTEPASRVAAPEADATAAMATAPATGPSGTVQMAQKLSRRAPVAESKAQQPMTTALPEANAENYAETEISPIKSVASEPVSTFSIDVDTGSYTNSRRMIADGAMPPVDAVRQEEFINYFDYGLPAPTNRNTPFSVTLEGMASPWNSKRELVMIGLKGYEVPKSEIPPSNLVFLIDVSGSMDEPNKLPLLKNAFRMLVNQLSARDRVSIVVYAGAAGAVLPPTPGDQKATILAALDQLQAGGSTNGGEGIELAYHFARQSLIEKGVNRIILATDGDFNVGNFAPNALKDYVSKQRKTGVSLSTLGFGQGNYNDEMTEQLADVGNGQHAYIDSLSEARKVLVEQISSTLFTIASDVKVQVEFNPAVVAEYRLIGYENRRLANEDFNNDQVDAGEIGAGHSVTAIYEIARVGSGGESLDAKRYAPNTTTDAKSTELGFLKLRYKLPGKDDSTLISTPIASKLVSSERIQFAASVAGFAEHLRGGKYLNGMSYADIAKLARRSKGVDNNGYRAEFIKLVEVADALDGGTSTAATAAQISE